MTELIVKQIRRGRVVEGLPPPNKVGGWKLPRRDELEERTLSDQPVDPREGPIRQRREVGRQHLQARNLSRLEASEVHAIEDGTAGVMLQSRSLALIEELPSALFFCCVRWPRRELVHEGSWVQGDDLVASPDGNAKLDQLWDQGLL